MQTHEGRSHSHPGVVEIGLRDVYDEVRRVAEGYGELSGKLDTAMSMHSMQFGAVERELSAAARDISDHESRLRSIELRHVVTPRSMWAAIGVLTGLVSAALAVIALFIR